MKHCTNCGNVLQDNEKFCNNCGAQVEQQDNELPVASAETVQQPNNTATVNAPKKRQSPLGIVAFILSLTVFLSPIAVVLAFIALVTNKGAKKGLAIAGLIIGTVLSLGLLIGILSPSSSSSTPNATGNESQSGLSDTNDKQPELTEAPVVDTKEAFIASCETVTYKDVERSPSSYEGKNIRIEGIVIQVSEGWLNTVTYRVATNPRGNDDIWYVTYSRSSDEERILEDDYVVMYGVCNGVESYKTVLGSTVTIPAMNAVYIETTAASEPEYTAEIVLLNAEKEKYGDNYEYDAVVEIRNTGDCNIYIKNASFDFEDADGHLLQTDDFEVGQFRTIIKPGEVGYLYTMYSIDLKGITSLDGLVLNPRFDAQATNVTLTEYDITDTSVKQGDFGISLTGRVTNNTNQDESYLYVRVVYYNAKGEVLGITGTSVSDLKAGATQSFEISGMFLMDFSVNDVASYTVLAEETYYGF